MMIYNLYEEWNGIENLEIRIFVVYKLELGEYMGMYVDVINYMEI